MHRIWYLSWAPQSLLSCLYVPHLSSLFFPTLRSQMHYFMHFSALFHVLQGCYLPLEGRLLSIAMWCSIIDLHLVREQQMWVAEV